MDQSVSDPAQAEPRITRAQLTDWAKTAATFALVAPLPAFMLWAAFSMPGMP